MNSNLTHQGAQHLLWELLKKFPLSLPASSLAFPIYPPCCDHSHVINMQIQLYPSPAQTPSLAPHASRLKSKPLNVDIEMRMSLLMSTLCPNIGGPSPPGLQLQFKHRITCLFSTHLGFRSCCPTWLEYLSLFPLSSRFRHILKNFLKHL